VGEFEVANGGLGYQNLIAMVFMLMAYRDDWMRVGKASVDPISETDSIPPLHLVLVEEPEAHLHAQVQQVFINNAYQLLRNHSCLGENEDFHTQLVVSTHSSHVAHEADFANLRYFRRRAALTPQEVAFTTVINLSHIFGDGVETERFVKRYLKATHCDLFFADGVIFVEGQAERLLVPHFIRHQFSALSRRYITLIELGGSHAHKFRPLVDELGITTVVIADLDAVGPYKTKDKKGVAKTVLKSMRPELGKGQRTANSVLKFWHPKKKKIDDLAAVDDSGHFCPDCDGYELYIAYQKPIEIDKITVIPRTFEDALIIENREVLRGMKGSSTSRKVGLIVGKNLLGEDLSDELFRLLKDAEKAAFALDCLMLDDPASIKAPAYIHAGLKWFESALDAASSDSRAPGRSK
jgi:predicted ATP-dependent endonuclease of OLD family